jgi:hypothetical protein
MDGYREYDPYEMEWYEYPCALTIEYSDVEGGLPLVYVGPTLATLNWGVGMMDADPIFVKGPLGDYYLSQIAAGQAADSPCVEAGYGVMFWPCLDNPPNFRVCGTTRTDREPDTGKVDLGYHYPFTGLKIPPGASLQGVPGAEEGIMQNEEKGGRK